MKIGVSCTSARMVVASLALVVTSSGCSGVTKSTSALESKAANQISRVTTAGFVTNDLDATIDFYTYVFGYELVAYADVSSERTLDVVGANCDRPVKYGAVAPKGWVEGNKLLALISFFEVPCAGPSPLPADGNRDATIGELILAQSVDDLDQVAARAKERGAPIVAELADSGTTRTSRSIAILDPNGIRLEIYDY